MAKHIHKRFTDEQVISLLQKYLTHEIEISYILNILGIERRRFFDLLKRYREDPAHFSIAYSRKKSTYKINDEIEKNIIGGLHIEKRLTEDKNMPIRNGNKSLVTVRSKLSTPSHHRPEERWNDLTVGSRTESSELEPERWSAPSDEQKKSLMPRLIATITTKSTAQQERFPPSGSSRQ